MFVHKVIFFILFLLFNTSCIPVNYHTGVNYGGQQKITLTPEYEGLNANLYLNARDMYFVPFLFSYSRVNHPASFRVQFWDYSNQLKALLIKNFYIEYQGEKVQTQTLNWKRVAKAQERVFQNGRKNVRYVWDNTPDFVDTSKKFKVWFDGAITLMNGESIQFKSSSLEFVPEIIEKELSFFEIMSV